MILFTFLFLDCLCLVVYGSVIVAVKSPWGGAVIGCDSALASGGMVASRQHRKLFPIDNNLMLCCASGESDFHKILDIVKSKYNTRRIQNSSNGMALSVESVSHLCRKLTYSKYCSSHMIIIGKSFNSNHYKIFEVLPKGTLIEHDKYAAAGSGSDCISALLDKMFEDLVSVAGDNMKPNNEESYALESKVRESIRIASSLDHRVIGLPVVIKMI